MSTVTAQDQLLFREAQLGNAAAAISQVDLSAVPAKAAALLEVALKALRASAPDAPSVPGDVGLRAQRAAEAHLNACEEALEAQEEAGYDVEVLSPACGPYDGCSDCQMRETLHAAWPVFEADARLNGLITDAP